MPALPTRRALFHLVGEGFNNADGSSRQGELWQCQPGESVSLHREPDNPYDGNAVLVKSSRGIGIGHLSRSDAALLAPHLDTDRPHTAKLHQLRGGVEDYESYGAVVSIAWDAKECPEHRPLDNEQRGFRAKFDAELADLMVELGVSPKSVTPARGCLSVALLLALLPGAALIFAR